MQFYPLAYLVCLVLLPDPVEFFGAFLCQAVKHRGRESSRAFLVVIALPLLALLALALFAAPFTFFTLLPFLPATIVVITTLGWWRRRRRVKDLLRPTNLCRTRQASVYARMSASLNSRTMVGLVAQEREVRGGSFTS